MRLGKLKGERHVKNKNSNGDTRSLNKNVTKGANLETISIGGETDRYLTNREKPKRKGGKKKK